MSEARQALPMRGGGSGNKTDIPEHALPLLERLVRLRVCTAPQARLLSPALARRGVRNAYCRLATLVRQGWLVADAVTPHRGAVTAFYYRPSHRALRRLGLERKVGLLQRPAQHVLEYLLFRTEVYTRARAEGWYVGSPSYLAPAQRAAALEHFNGYLQRRAVERYRAAQASQAGPSVVGELRVAAERLQAFLPKELDFEFLYRVDAAGHVSELVLLLVDDVRRSVTSQVGTLPLAAGLDCSVLIRDCDSVYCRETASVRFVGARLRELERGVRERFGEGLPINRALLEGVWARTQRPSQREAVASPRRKESP